MEDTGTQALAALKESPSLHTLTLDLQGNSVGDRGAQALAALKMAPALHTLTLELWGNRVGASWAQALAALKEAHYCDFRSSIFGAPDWEPVGHRHWQP